MNNKIHTLNGYFHNVIGLLKYLKEDDEIKNSETKEMLEFALTQENEILKTLENLKIEVKNEK